MAKFLLPIFALAGVAIFLLPSPLQAGDDGPRREFHQSNVYPYTFQPVSYLETGGPKRMRYDQPPEDCSHRDAPLLPTPTPTPIPRNKPATESMEKNETAAVATPAPVKPAPTGVAPAFPPSANAPTAGGPDLKKMPEEVMDYFKNPYNSGPHGPHLFDPIFEPGYHQGPTSKATYELSDKP